MGMLSALCLLDISLVACGRRRQASWMKEEYKKGPSDRLSAQCHGCKHSKRADESNQWSRNPWSTTEVAITAIQDLQECPSPLCSWNYGQQVASLGSPGRWSKVSVVRSAWLTQIGPEQWLRSSTPDHSLVGSLRHSLDPHLQSHGLFSRDFLIRQFSESLLGTFHTLEVLDISFRGSWLAWVTLMGLGLELLKVA